jgi:hypothetical protein
MFRKKKDDKLSQYEEPIGGFSSKDLRLATWYVKHKDQLRAIFVICFFILDVALIGYGFWGWAEYAILGYRQDHVMHANQVVEVEDYTVQHVRYAARDLQFASPEMYESGINRYDFVMDVQNSNEKWVAEITYQFVFGGGMTESKTMTVMPGVRQPLAVFGVQSAITPSGVRFQPLHIKWKSVDPHIVSDPTNYLAKRNNFVIGDVEFSFSSDEDTGGHQVVFDVTNDTVFSYWSPQFLVEFRDGDKREGLFFITIDEFESGQTSIVQIQSFAENLYVSNVVLHPLINFFDASEYMQ